MTISTTDTPTAVTTAGDRFWPDAQLRQAIDLIEHRLTRTPEDLRVSLPVDIHRLILSRVEAFADILTEVLDDGALPIWLDQNLLRENRARRSTDLALSNLFAEKTKDPTEALKAIYEYLRLAYVTEQIDPFVYVIRNSKYYPDRVDELFTTLRDVAAANESDPKITA